MKHILLTLFGLSIVACLQAQNHISDVLKLHSPSARLKSESELECAYESYAWNEDYSLWDLMSKSTYSRNGNGEILMSETYSKDENILTPTNRYQYVYDNGQVIIYTVENWNETAWTNSSRIKYMYNAQGIRTSGTYQSWDAVKNEWTDASRSMTTFNPDGSEITISQTWDGTSWIDTERLLSSDDGDGKLDFVTQKWDKEIESWINEYGINFISDDSKNLLEVNQTIWNSGLDSWAETGRTFFTYDEKNHEVLRIDQRRNSSNDGWEDYAKDTLIYDGNKLIAEVRTALNFSRIWEPLSNTTYTREGNTDVQTVQYWNGDWINNTRYVTFYDCPITGVADDRKASMYIFPNPSNGIFNFNALASESTIVIYDLEGRQINKTIASGESSVVNLEGNTVGVYYYNLITKGGSSISGKLILK